MEPAGGLTGVVKDTKGEPIPFVEVAVLKDGVLITGITTNTEGKYIIKNVPAGRYTVKAEALGYATQEDSGVQINLGRITYLDFTMQNQSSS
jgi:iron complex outermembrane recepter protein